MKRKNSIFPKLMGSYFAFAAIAVLTYGVFVILTMVSWLDQNMEKLVPSQMVCEDGTIGDIEILEKSGGWAEKLSDDLLVEQTYGAAARSHGSYTMSELLQLTGSDDNGTDYHVFYISKGGSNYLFYIPLEAMHITYTWEMSEQPMSAQQVLLWIGLPVLLILDSVFVSRFIYCKIRKPMYALVDGMQQMENGEQNVRLTFQADGEFMILRDAFNDMNQKLSDEKNRNKKMQEAQQKMILELSHDIRTPIATINSCAAALAEGIVSPQEKEKYYDIISTKALRVNEMADEMFTLLKMENASYQPDLKKLDLCEFGRRICAEYYEDAEQNNLVMEIAIPDQSIFIDADFKLLQRAVGNLLSNAIKYNRTGQRVGIHVGLGDASADIRQIYFDVWDDGEPIDEAFVPYLFDPFSRADQARNSMGGTGLGLAIAREIVEKHSGTIAYFYEDNKNQLRIAFPLPFFS